MSFVDVIIIYNLCILTYFLILNSFYLVLLVFASQRLWYYKLRSKSRFCEESKCKSLPSIALLVPSYNEENTIVDSIKAICKNKYPKMEIIIINDGSKDKTLEVLKNSFNLFRDHRDFEIKLETEKVLGVYKSAIDERIIVIDKVNGGKADALNVGLNYSRSRLYLAIDADSIVDSEAIERMIQPYLERDSKIIGIGGIVRVANGSIVKDGNIVEARLPNNLLAGFQVIEYIRAFLCGRAGWSKLRNLLIISGAFGLFERKTVVEIGGYRRNILGEDMELVIRLHKYMKKKKKEYDIIFVPDPVCWTQVPEKSSVLALQRIRWHQGLIQSLRIHWSMIFNPKYGTVGLIAMPYFFLFEFLGPIIEISGYITFIGAYILGLMNITFAALFFLLAIIFGVLISLFSLILEEFTSRRYDKPWDIFKLLIIAVIENFGYRQITAWWRFKATILLLFRKKKWGEMEKISFKSIES